MTPGQQKLIHQRPIPSTIPRLQNYTQNVQVDHSNTRMTQCRSCIYDSNTRMTLIRSVIDDRPIKIERSSWILVMYVHKLLRHIRE